jgi:serine/threonine protein kinase
MNQTAPIIGISREDFLTGLAASRLLPQPEIDQFLATRLNEDVFGLANALVTAGILTDFQLDAITQGRAAELRIGNYDVLDRLGAGGMGTVFKARHRRMKRIVALKVLSGEFCKDEHFIQRFQREVETIARLGHPNVVMAYDADEAEIGHFLVMEYVDGKDLIAFVETNHPVGIAPAVDCIVQAARGLGFAHAQGIIHRDIKPGNLLRDSNGVVKVTDLGLARLNAGDAVSSAASGLTQAGGVLGTVDYMAPEQAVDSTTVDLRADVYSLGATLHFLLTGRPPYSGKSAMQVLLKHRDSPIPSLRDERPDVPPELDDVFKRMMAKREDDRYASMAEVIAALEGVSAHLEGKPSAPQTPIVATGAKPDTKIPSETIVTHAIPLSVVIVEPSRVQAGFIRKYLEAQELVAAAAVGTGAAAVAAVREHQPDAVVSSLHLSDMTGVELAKRIRDEFKDDRPGFVLITSEADGSDPGTLSRLNRVHLLSKPFTQEQLVQALIVVTGKSIAVKTTDLSLTGLAGLKTSSDPNSGVKSKRDRSTLRVLIVEDSTVARVNERMVLEGMGFARFVEAADGAQAIAAATREPFDLIVTDYNMPLMDGYALISYLRQSPATAEIPIVMVTSETAAAVLDPVRQLGVAAVFDKAFSAADVKPVVDRLFG